MASRGEYTIVYGGRSHDIETDTFIRSLTSVTALIQEVNHDLGTGQPLAIRIKAVRPGCFELQVAILSVLQSVHTLLTAENFTTIKDVMAAVISLFEIRKLLTAKKPAEVVEQHGDGIVLKNSDGNQVTYNKNVFHFYGSNRKALRAIEETFAALERDGRVSSFKILDKKRVAAFEARRKDFPRLASVKEEATGSAEEEAPKKKTRTPRTEVTILRPSFKKELTWDIVFGSIKVPAKLTDDNFQKEITKGEEFRSGDVLDCDLEITQTRDRRANVYIDKSYKIVRVYDHKKAQETELLPFEN